jgi:hypothetical protein
VSSQKRVLPPDVEAVVKGGKASQALHPNVGNQAEDLIFVELNRTEL